LGVFGEVRLEKNDGEYWPGFPSSVRFQNLREAESFLHSLWSPQWPASILQHQLDAGLVENGRKVYEQKKCIQCHALIDRSDKERKANEVMVGIGTPSDPPQFNVGTDSTMADNFVTDRTVGKLLENEYKYFSLNKWGSNTSTAPAGEILAYVVTGAILHAPANAGQELPQARGFALEARKVLKYKARPLNGIWATAPYLHNGSVPSLMTLLGPVDKRPTKFIVGRREYDPDEIGFRYALDEGVALGFKPFDTTVEGNFNTGHVYGSEDFTWTDDEKGTTETIKRLTEGELKALMEFLRSL